MKQLHKPTSAYYRRDEEITGSQTAPYSPKALKHSRSISRSIHYLFKEQRLLFILVGILIGSTFFILQPTLYRIGPPDSAVHSSLSRTASSSFPARTGFGSYSSSSGLFPKRSVSARVPAGIGRRRSRIVVTGGAGFVGSHLVDKLISRGDEVIVIDNFFTGRKENLVHLFGNPRFELIRHDVVEPILLEVDQIYHLACPASPVHYKFNPVKTIISFSF
uniref:UDP-glucuronate decarboxylase n=1 Tax=Rhizophora mucronata TaxID=61149 RepID=A0A2P2M444_RHIMU